MTRGQKTVGPVLPNTDHGPPVGFGSSECLLTTAGVVELALGVIVEYEEPQCRLVGVVGELEHWDVAVGVPGREHWPSAGAVPDPDRLLRAVIEVVGLALVGDGSPALVAGVGEGGAAADDLLARMPYMSAMSPALLAGSSPSNPWNHDGATSAGPPSPW